MCGIAGYYNYNGIVDIGRFEKMVDIIEHRGPDDRGTYYYKGVALGHRRLAVIDVSADGHQPFFYRNRYVVIFNGEIYNYLEIKKELEEKGYIFKTKTDTEVLIAAYDYYGKECVHHFNGMWSFVILDKIKNKLYCSRDRFGIKPFYYYIDDKEFIFGSEIKQILYMQNRRPSANKKRLLEFLIRGDQDYTDETMFQGIMQLRGGHEIVFDLNSNEFTINQYYDLGKRKIQNRSYEESCDSFRTTFENSIELRLRSDVPLGYCLSGGLDSSAIVSMANQLIKQTRQKTEQHAISSCFEDEKYDEQEYIDEVIKYTGIYSHKIYPDANDLFSNIDRIIWHMDEPFGSTSIYAQWNVFEEASKRGLTVMLDGQGADEQLAGYSPFYGVFFADILKQHKYLTFIHEIKKYKELRASTEKYVSAKKIILEAVATAYVPKNLSQIMKETYVQFTHLPFRKEQIHEVYSGRILYSMKDAKKYILDSMQFGLQALLHYEDRNSMAFSIESRVPFLDFRLVETIFEMPFEHKIKDGITKSVMRDGLAGILPEKIRTRYSKLGFVTPEDKWIKNNYEQYKNELEKACDLLYPLIDKKQLMKWFSKEKIARGNFLVWRIICAGKWAKVFNVKID